MQPLWGGVCVALFWAIVIVLGSCAFAVGPDAQLACYRIEAAIHAAERRCGFSFRGELADCSSVVAGYTDSSKAKACEEELAMNDCEEPGLPAACEASFLEGL